MLSEKDKKDWENFIKGNFKIYLKPSYSTNINNYKIDLHGLTIQESFDLLKETLPKCSKNNIKELLIITGASGQIRKEFTEWVKNPIFKKYIKKVEQKNTGSFILTLKF